MIIRVMAVAAVLAGVLVGFTSPSVAAGGRSAYKGSYPSLYDCQQAGAVRMGDEGWWDYECRPDGNPNYALYAIYY